MTTSLKQQEAASTQRRRSEVDVKNPVTNPSVTIPSTEAAHPLNKDCPDESTSSSCPQTDAPNLNIPHETVDLYPEEIINRIGAKHQLNGKQWVAFRIIARSFIKTHLHMSDTPEPIRILLTGPGGTGKTHIVNALCALMAMYGSEHTLRFLAPTGSAALLIDGMTIHKGLGIKMKFNQKGKGNRESGESSEDYTVLISVRNRTLLRNEWRLVKVLFIDEVSLLSEQLMSEIDHALRYATECPDEWFSGINVIFAGDFFQYPPICATPLYTPISDRNGHGKDDVPRRLGRLAWKTVNAVISLMEQEHMKGDPEYARAVNNLRIHQCSQQDIDLFNSRVIKSVDNPNGVDMSADDKVNSTAIVSTNLLRENINARKARANCQGPNSPTLITCSAHDDIVSGPCSSEIIKHLLNMNMSKLTADGALPGFVPLYVGMPVCQRLVHEWLRPRS
jgi:PIF1-like helicase